MEPIVKSGRSKGLFAKKALDPILRDEADESIESIAAAAPAADGWMHTLSAVISTDVPPPARGTPTTW